MHNHAPADYRCPFCLLLQGVADPEAQVAQSDILVRDPRVTAFLSSHQWPRNPGNVLIVPNEHFENIYDLPPEYAVDIQRLARRVALALKAAYGCGGVSLRQHNEPAGSQHIWHYHVHVTPRHADDGFYLSYASGRELMPPEERAWHAERLRRELRAQADAEPRG